MQKPKLGDGKKFFQKLVRKAKSIFRGLQKSSAGFWVCSPLSLPVHHITLLKPINELLLRIQLWHVVRKLGIRNPIVWVACPVACDVATKIKRVKLVYQRTDLFEEYPNVDADMVRRYDRKLKACADLTIYVSHKLYKEEAEECKKAIYLDHGVDYEMFATAENNREIPADIKDIKRPIVGFFGGIDDHTFDVELAEKIIDLLPDMSFVFVGKASVNCDVLLSRKNVWMLGYKPYDEIPHYGKCFDVAIMPWRQNRWIEACNPIKLKEYLALGKPVVSTPFGELQKYRGLVYIAHTPDDFARCIEIALAENSPERIVGRRRAVEKTTWDSKARLVLEELFGNNSTIRSR
jgi:glycosyltransferase involved in cell wall biosynthesis